MSNKIKFSENVVKLHLTKTFSPILNLLHPNPTSEIDVALPELIEQNPDDLKKRLYLQDEEQRQD